MTKVYTVSGGEYERRILGVFSTSEKAQEYIDIQKNIQTLEKIDDSPREWVLDHGRLPKVVYFEHDEKSGTISLSDKQDGSVEVTLLFDNKGDPGDVQPLDKIQESSSLVLVRVPFETSLSNMRERATIRYYEWAARISSNI